MPVVWWASAGVEDGVVDGPVPVFCCCCCCLAARRLAAEPDDFLAVASLRRGFPLADDAAEERVAESFRLRAGLAAVVAVDGGLDEPAQASVD